MTDSMPVNDGLRGIGSDPTTVLEYFEMIFLGELNVDVESRGGRSTLCGHRRKKVLFLNLGVTGDTMGLSEMGVGGKDRSRSGDFRMYEA